MTQVERIAPADFMAMTAIQSAEWMESVGEKPYRAKQIRSWIFDKGLSDFDMMSNISKQLRALLNENARITDLKKAARTESSDGTLKILFKTDDNHAIESVLIPDGKRRTLCVSTQIGCKLACRFCLTGQCGFTRNLSAGEIVDQLVKMRRIAPDGQVTNIVLMGMGEPLDNYDNVLQALLVLTEPGSGLIGARKVTLSTAGVAPMIARLAKDYPKIKLAVSLNGASDQTRNTIMPINKKYPIAKLLVAIKRWPLPKGRLITFEYVLIKGVNDSDEEAEKLANLTRGFPCKINLIPFNPCPGLPYERPDEAQIVRFTKIASSKGQMVFQRVSRGADILAACGQLRETTLTKQ